MKIGKDDIPKEIVVAVWMTLKDLKEDHGPGGLIAARRAATGSAKEGAMLDEYGLTERGRMPDVTKQVICALVSSKGELTRP